jgi:MoaA/NifB/PqqE/SkfB family radical SAM enzyme
VSTGGWRESAKSFLRRVLPPGIHDPLLDFARSTRDLAGSKAERRKLLLRHAVCMRGYSPKRLYPKLLSLCLTTRCNLRCFICRRENVKAQDLMFENLFKVRNAIRHASTIDLTGWGESLLYPRFEDVLAYIFSLNARDGLIQVTSNGTLLSGRLAALLAGHLGRMTISLNAAKEETYSREMRPGDFGKTMRSVRGFLSGLPEVDRRKILFHFVAHTGNFHEIPDFIRLARENGVSSVSVGQYLVDIAEHHRYSLLNAREEYNTVIREAEALGRELGVTLFARRFFTEEASSGFECVDPYDACFIEVDGQVGPCCFSGSYRIGNVFDSGFESVWFGEGYRQLRKKRYLPACRNCSPYIPFDDPGAHFTAYLKEKEEFREIHDMYGKTTRSTEEAT